MYDWTAKPCIAVRIVDTCASSAATRFWAVATSASTFGQLALDTVVLLAEIERLVVQRVDLAGDLLRFLALVVDRAGRRRARDADGADDEERTQDEAARHDRGAPGRRSSHGHGA